MNKPEREFSLIRKHDQVFLRYADVGDEVSVRVVWTRPISGRGGEISLLDEKKKEIMMLKSVDLLDPDSRAIAEAELDHRYLVPRITRVISTAPHFGSRYFHVETNLGPRRFVLKDPNKNATWVTEDHLVIRDTLGNRYEINPFSGLDARSQAEVDKVL